MAGVVVMVFGRREAGACEAAVLDPTGGDDAVGELADVFGFAAHDHDLDAVVSVVVDVGSAADVADVVVLMLDTNEVRFEAACGMIIDDGDGADDSGTGVLPLAIHEMATDNVADGLGAIGVALVGDGLVEGLQQVLGHGDAEALYVAHYATSLFRISPVDVAGKTPQVLALERGEEAD